MIYKGDRGGKRKTSNSRLHLYVLELVGDFLRLQPVFLIPFAFLVALYTVTSNYDSVFVITEYLGKHLGHHIPQNWKGNTVLGIAVWLVRVFVLLIELLDILRTLIALLFIFASLAILLNSAVRSLDELYREKETFATKYWFIGMYVNLVLALRVLSRAAKIGIFLLLLMMAIGIVFLNTLIVLGYAHVPLALFICFPILLFYHIAILYILFPLVIFCHEWSQDILNVWSVQCCSGANRGYWRRKIWSLSILNMYGGMGDYSFFLLCKDTKTDYYWAILNYTVTVLMSVELNK